MRLGDLDQRATANHGVISMHTSGLGRSSWYRAIRSGQLEQLHPGVARLHGTADTPEQRIMAALLAVGMPALASHRSAAHLWGFERPASDPVDVIVVGRRRFPTLDGVVIHRPKDLERLRPQRRDNIACTNILRTLLDLGAVDGPAVVDAVGDALANHRVTLATLESVVVQHSEHGRAGIVALRNAVDAWAIDRKPADSLLEATMQRLVVRYRLPPVEFHPVIGGVEVDFRDRHTCASRVRWMGVPRAATRHVRARPWARRSTDRRRLDRDPLHLPGNHVPACRHRTQDRRRRRPLVVTVSRSEREQFRFPELVAL